MCTETGCTHEVNDVQNVEIGESEALSQPNEFGCMCSPKDLCEVCSEPIEVEYLDTDEDGGEEKHYPHISELCANAVVPAGPALQDEQTTTFRSFISRMSR